MREEQDESLLIPLMQMCHSRTSSKRNRPIFRRTSRMAKYSNLVEKNLDFLGDEVRE